MTWITQQPLPTPVTRRKHLVTVRQEWNYNGQRYRYQTALAVYIRRFTEEYDGDIDDFGEYNEANDICYCPEGWYEVGDSHPDYSYWPIDGEVVAIKIAPKPWQPEQEPEVPDHDPHCCPRCNGSGYDPDPQPMCCGNGTLHGCCGEPIPDHGPCQDCHGTGNNYQGTNIPEALWGQEDPDAEGGFIYPCQSCQENSPIYCDPTEFDPQHHYCGRSPMCCP